MLKYTPTKMVRPMVDMEREVKPIGVIDAPCESQSEYPWGLKLCLTNEELEKLGVDPAGFVIGGTLHGNFMACVTSVSSSQNSDGACHRVELQIEKLFLESEDVESEEIEEAAEAAQPPVTGLRRLYK